MPKPLKVTGYVLAALTAAFVAMLSISSFSEKKLHALSVGMTPAEVLGVMGKPDQTNGTMWFYNPRRPSPDVLLLHFDESNRLEYFSID
jgi:hypothetical protein